MVKLFTAAWQKVSSDCKQTLEIAAEVCQICLHRSQGKNRYLRLLAGLSRCFSRFSVKTVSRATFAVQTIAVCLRILALVKIRFLVCVCVPAVCSPVLSNFLILKRLRFWSTLREHCQPLKHLQLDTFQHNKLPGVLCL